MLFWANQGVRIFRSTTRTPSHFRFENGFCGKFARGLPTSFSYRRPSPTQGNEGTRQARFLSVLHLLHRRTAKEELQAYLAEITGYPEREYFRPNFFVTTPDILPVQLQAGEPWMFKSRAALAATLSSNYGIYNGFELVEHEPIPGHEEYINSEK